MCIRDSSPPPHTNRRSGGPNRTGQAQQSPLAPLRPRQPAPHPHPAQAALPPEAEGRLVLDGGAVQVAGDGGERVGFAELAQSGLARRFFGSYAAEVSCLLYTSDAADDLTRVDLG